jgi:hypothetical protein
MIIMCIIKCQKWVCIYGSKVIMMVEEEEMTEEKRMKKRRMVKITVLGM